MQSAIPPLPTPTLNASQVIGRFGGVTALVGLAHANGLADYSQKTVQKWRERNSIPMDRWLELMALAKTARFELNINDHLKWS